jgi:hypothetical protein
MGPQRSKGNGENTDNTHKIKSFGAGASKASAVSKRAMSNPLAGQIYPPVYPDTVWRGGVRLGVKASTTTRTITADSMGAALNRLREGVALRSRCPLVGGLSAT